MIDDFDSLAARCAAKKQRYFIRLSLSIGSSLLLVYAGIMGYQLWRMQAPAPVKKPAKTKPAETIPSAAVSEANLSVEPPFPSEAASAAVPGAVPAAATTPVHSAAKAPAKPASIPAPVLRSGSALPIPPVTQNRLLEVSSSAGAPVSDPVAEFQNAPKYETAITIARDFYAKENYVESAKWAKKANQLNREADEAWLLYARSTYAQGRKNDAIGILELFLNYKESKTAADQLRSWKSNQSNN